MSLLIEKALSHLSRTVDLVPVEIDESVVYVTELSKQTLNSYVGKAAQSVLFKGMEAGRDMGRSDYKAGAKKVQKGLSRGEGIKKAAARLTKEDIEGFIQSEEFEQLDELSKQTLGSYISKSAKQAKALSGEAGYRASRSSEMARTGNPKSSDAYANLSNRDDNKAEARLKGINKAIKKLTKEDIEDFIQSEEFDQLDELSKQTLGSYIKKASHSVATLGAVTRQLSNDARDAKTDNDYTGFRKKSNQADKVFKHSWKRRKGMEAAVDRLTKEDIEDFIQTEEFDQLDELSKKTLQSYIGKAKKETQGNAAYGVELANQGDLHGSKKFLDHAVKTAKNIKKAQTRVLAKEDIQYLIDNIDQLDESERYQLAQIALREDYTAKGNIYHGGETHKFKVTYGDFPSHRSIQEQNPHLKKHHVDAVMNHFETHGDDDMTGTESEHEASGSEVHVHHNSGNY